MAATAGHGPYGIIGVSLGRPVETGRPRRRGLARAELGSSTWASIVGVGHLFSPSGMASAPTR